jgi:hypothetical protein
MVTVFGLGFVSIRVALGASYLNPCGREHFMKIFLVG